MLLAAGEAGGLALERFASALPLAPQVVAPAPFGAYHDLRWVFTFASSWWSLAWQLAALLVFRTALTTVLSTLAWPADVPRPTLPVLARRSAVATLLAVVVFSPWVTLAFASSTVSYSWFMLASIVAAVATAVVLPSALVAGRWWRRLVPWRGMLLSLVAWVALMLEALAVSYAPGWVAVPAAAAGGALNALLWQRQVAALVHAPAPRHRLPLAPAGVLAVLAVFLLGGGYLIGQSRPSSPQSHQHTGGGEPVGSSLLYVPGYGSHYDGRAFQLLGRSVWHFSYAGLTTDNRPAPYDAAVTHESLAVSAATLATQVELLTASTHQPVVLLADSEGSLVVRRYLQTHAHPAVRMFVEASPLLRPGRVFFPAAGRNGYGFVGGWEARGLLGLIRWENPGFGKTADQPFVRSVVENAGRLRGVTMCPVPGVAVYAFVPFEGALTVYDQPVAHVPWTAVPGWHATLLDNPTVQHDVEALIRTGHQPTHDKSTAAFPVISAAASAWQVPALPLDLHAGWRSAASGSGGGTGSGSDAAFADWDCRSSR